MILMQLYGKIIKSGLIGAAFLCLVSGAAFAVNPFAVKAKGDKTLSLLQERAGKGCSVEAIMPKIQQVKPLGDAGKLDEADALLDEILAWFAQTPCGDGDKTALPDDPVNTEWSHDQVVTIKGYSGDAMEPFISRDGAYLFFNDDKIADKEKDMFWAKRVDDTTFSFQGEIENVNSSYVDGVPSMDDHGRFFFMSAHKYGFFNKTTVYSGIFKDGAVEEIVPHDSLALGKLGWLNMDIEISADGRTLYSTQTHFEGSVPVESYFFYAKKDGDSFVPQEDSAKIFATLNKDKVVYAASISRDEKEIFYTRLLPGLVFQSLVAKRTNKDSAFGEPEVIAAITGFAEAPALSADETMLYYHKRNEKTGKFEIRVLQRKG
ncbi:MAG: hypothetical protein KA099_02925 [Alphaproteobacteria bacterium]|nr:hypothetical protein [Alphaproteobacteria bacterium]MBP7904256.1 hypothetical protein [Alphaproteobacteria bacterium]